MRDVKTEMRSALYASEDLLNILGGKHVYKLTAPEPKRFPRIVLFDVSNRDSDYADDNPIAMDYIVQVSIFSQEETLAIFNEVDKTLKAAGWRLGFAEEFFEEDTGIYHRPCRYRQKFLND